MPTGRRTLYASLKIGFCLAGALILLTLTWQSRQALSEAADDIRPAVFAGAVALGLMLTVAQGLYFGLLMRKNGSRASLRAALVAYLLSQPGKYIPGKIWAPLMQKASLGDRGSLLAIGACNVELTVVVLVQMGALGIACLCFGDPLAAAAAMLSGIVIGAAILKFRALAALLQRLPWLARRLGMELPAPQGAATGFLPALGLSSTVIVLTLLASWVVLEAMGQGTDLQRQATLLGTLFMGFGSGILMFVVPAGLGVREAATVGIGSVTAPGVAEGLLVTVALFARAWQLAVDAASLLLGLALDRRD